MARSQSPAYRTLQNIRSHVEFGLASHSSACIGLITQTRGPTDRIVQISQREVGSHCDTYPSAMVFPQTADQQGRLTDPFTNNAWHFTCLAPTWLMQSKLDCARSSE